MLKSLFRLAIIVIIGVLVYNYFLGSETEKAQSKKVFNGAKELVVSVKDIVKSEKNKFDEGKYDKALDKVGNLFQTMKEKGSEIADKDYLGEVQRLEERRTNLRDRLAEIEAKLSGDSSSTELKEEKNQLTNDLDQLIQDADALIDKSEQ